MAGDLSSGAKCVKYTLFLFNLLFLLAGLALIIVGAIVQVQATKSGLGNTASAAGIFIIVIGSVVFVVAFFGCAGAVNSNYCMITTYGVLLLILLLLEIAAVIAGFVLKNKVQSALSEEMSQTLIGYDPNSPTNIQTNTWDNWQKDWKCCGTNGTTTWTANPNYRADNITNNNNVPDSCCVNMTTGCGSRSVTTDPKFQQGCVDELVGYIKKNLIAVGATAAAVALLEVLGIVFAFCLAHCLRKDYKVVKQ